MAENSNGGKKIFFISVTDKEDTNNRKYSDFIHQLCMYSISKDDNLNRMIDETKFIRHDQRAELNLKISLAECLNYDVFVVLLDCFERDYNPNVWFELGVVATSAKPIILIAQEETHIPFDVHDLNILKIHSDLVKRINLSVNQYNAIEFDNFLDTADRKLARHINRFSSRFNKFLLNGLNNGNPFSIWFDKFSISELGYTSLKDLFINSGIMSIIDNPDVRAEYIPGERAAFEALINEVSKAKESLRTTRFANQSIVAGDRNNDDIHADFMKALYKASERVSKCDRIICNNSPLKWHDILNVLLNSTSKMKVYVRQFQFDIGFELVIIDEKVAFIHFYQMHIPGDNNEDGGTYQHEVEVINSTLKIRGESVCQKLANIFDRLHHRDFGINQNPSRTLLGVPKKKDLNNDDERNRGFFQLPKGTSDNQREDEFVRQQKRDKLISMFISAFDTWKLTDENDIKTMAVGLCSLNKEFEANLEKHLQKCVFDDNKRVIIKNEIINQLEELRKNVNLNTSNVTNTK